MFDFVYLIFAGTGLLAGSFLNVISSRLYEGRNFVFGRSKCDFCKKDLRPSDLIPVISYLINRGKCYFCKKKIDIFYPISEITSAVFFCYAYFLIKLHNLNLNYLIYFLIGFSLFLIIFYSDYKYYEIPFPIVVLGVVFSTAYRYFILSDITINNYLYEIFSAMVLFTFFYLIIFISKGGMGGGDLKLSIFISLFLGYPSSFYGIYYGIVMGGIFALILLLLRVKGLKAKIPLGPFLILGVLVELFFKTF